MYISCPRLPFSPPVHHNHRHIELSPNYIPCLRPNRLQLLPPVAIGFARRPSFPPSVRPSIPLRSPPPVRSTPTHPLHANQTIPSHPNQLHSNIHPHPAPSPTFSASHCALLACLPTTIPYLLLLIDRCQTLHARTDTRTHEGDRSVTMEGWLQVPPSERNLIGRAQWKVCLWHCPLPLSSLHG